MYLYIEFENGGFLCSDHATSEDWESFKGLNVTKTEWRSRITDEEVDWDTVESMYLKAGEPF